MNYHNPEDIHQKFMKKSEDPCSSSDVQSKSHGEESVDAKLFCDYCNDAFTERKILQLHIRIMHSVINGYVRKGLQWYTCRDCPEKLFNQPNRITDHMRLWHDKIDINPEDYIVKTLQDIKYACKVCSKPCYRSATCDLHPMKDTNECDQHFDHHTCSECGSKHNDCQSLWSHVFLEHSNTFVRCNICPHDKYTPTNKSSVLISHMQQIHKKAIVLDPNSPEILEKKKWEEFLNECRLPGKIRGKTMYKCPHCSKVVENIKPHMNIHTKKRTFVCEECGACFLHSTSLREHKASHSDTRYECAYCGRTYQRRTVVMRHIDHYHVNKWKSLCKICNKHCLDLSNHLTSVHSSARPYVCSACGLSYKRLHHLKTHLKACKFSNV
jgi:hypothetical protein